MSDVTANFDQAMDKFVAFMEHPAVKRRGCPFAGVRAILVHPIFNALSSYVDSGVQELLGIALTRAITFEDVTACGLRTAGALGGLSRCFGVYLLVFRDPCGIVRWYVGMTTQALGFDGRCNDWHHAVRKTLEAYPGSTYNFHSLVAVNPAGFAVNSKLFAPVVKFFEGFFAFVFGTVRDPRPFYIEARAASGLPCVGHRLNLDDALSFPPERFASDADAEDRVKLDHPAFHTWLTAPALDKWRDEHASRGFTLKLTIEGMEKMALLTKIECNAALEAHLRNLQDTQGSTVRGNYRAMMLEVAMEMILTFAPIGSPHPAPFAATDLGRGSDFGIKLSIPGRPWLMATVKARTPINTVFTSDICATYRPPPAEGSDELLLLNAERAMMRRNLTAFAVRSPAIGLMLAPAIVNLTRSSSLKSWELSKAKWLVILDTVAQADGDPTGFIRALQYELATFIDDGDC